MILIIIAAISDNGVIGRDGGLPWKLRDDMRWFKESTMGHPIVMGRRTYESNGAALPGRPNIVVSQTMDAHQTGIQVARSFENALSLAREHLDSPVGEVFIIGGACVYGPALAVADRMYLTRVHTRVVGDTKFPRIDWSRWRKIRQEAHKADEHNEHAFTICEFARRDGTL